VNLLPGQAIKIFRQQFLIQTPVIQIEKVTVKETILKLEEHQKVGLNIRPIGEQYKGSGSEKVRYSSPSHWVYNGFTK
jgi:hypothetical protein